MNPYITLETELFNSAEKIELLEATVSASDRELRASRRVAKQLRAALIRAEKHLSFLADTYPSTHAISLVLREVSEEAKSAIAAEE